MHGSSLEAKDYSAVTEREANFCSRIGLLISTNTDMTWNPA